MKQSNFDPGCQPEDHAFEELPDGTARCFECGLALTQEAWAERKLQLNQKVQMLVEVGASQPCPMPTRSGGSPPSAASAGSAEHQLEWLWANCTIVYWPGDGSYPVEHNPHASKYAREIIEAKMPNVEVSHDAPPLKR